MSVTADTTLGDALADTVAAFDHVVLATHPDQALAVLGDGATADERADYGAADERDTADPDRWFTENRPPHHGG